jgi:hypothetical protein
MTTWTHIGIPNVSHAHNVLAGVAVHVVAQRNPCRLAATQYKPATYLGNNYARKQGIPVTGSLQDSGSVPSRSDRKLVVGARMARLEDDSTVVLVSQ